MAFKVFIGWDPRESFGAKLCAWSLRKHSSVDLEIIPLHLAKLNEDYGYNPIPRPASTEFAYTRFLIPRLCDYEGQALFLDGSDMLALGDIAELVETPMEGCAIKCVQHDFKITTKKKMDGQVQQNAPRKLWASCMLMNCEKLTLWTKNLVENVSGAYLHRFMDIPDEMIGALDPKWNEVYGITPETKIFHWTEGGPFFPKCRNCVESAMWWSAAKALLAERNRPIPSDWPAETQDISPDLYLSHARAA